MKCRNCGEVFSCDTTDEKSQVIIDWLNRLIESVDDLPPEIKKEVIKGCRTAKVINSVLNGDKSCVYEIRWDL